MSTPFRLLIPRRIYEEMLNHAYAELPNECCGFLGGVREGDGPVIGRAEHCYPMINADENPTRRFQADPKSIVQAIRDMRERELEELAIYHSHPTSEPIPSRTDLERNYWPGVVSVIISLKSDEPEVRAWWLSEVDYREAEWEVV